jgi:hypothetical protein
LKVFDTDVPLTVPLTASPVVPSVFDPTGVTDAMSEVVLPPTI